SITARQTEAGKSQSADGPALAVTIDTVAPAAPGAPNLQAGSDSGSSNSDDLTNLTGLTFDVAAAPYFRVGRNAVQISGDYEAGSTYTATSQAAGTWSYAVQAVDAAGNASGFGPALNLTIDLTVPTVLGLVAVAPDPRTTPVTTVDVAF